jgi:hypothetical protein
MSLTAWGTFGPVRPIGWGTQWGSGHVDGGPALG